MADDVALLLTRAVVLDATGAPPFEGGILVVDGTIREVYRDHIPTIRMEHREVDCRGGTLLPGLIDAHVHLGALDEAFEHQARMYPMSLAAFKAAARLKAMLALGYTTVRDAGGADAGFQRALAEGLIGGPRLLISCRPISQTGGHGDYRTQAEPATVVRYEGEFGMPCTIADGESEVRRAVREQLRRGADVIKVFASGGAASPTDRVDGAQYSLGELRAAVEEADDAGAHVMAHALPPRAIIRCAEAGVRSVEHGNFLDQPAADALVRAGTYLVPTMATYMYVAEHPEAYQFPQPIQEKIDFAASKAEEALRVALAAGVAVASGSDMLGADLHLMSHEHVYKAAVMGSQKAIESTTRVNAELLGLADKLGTIEPGKVADLIVAREDPIANIGVLTEESGVALVMQRGTLVHDRRSD